MYVHDDGARKANNPWTAALSRSCIQRKQQPYVHTYYSELMLTNNPCHVCGILNWLNQANG